MKSFLSLISNFATAFFALFSIPIFLNHYGPEQYAIIALYNLIFALASVLDISLSQLLMREGTKLKSKTISTKDFLHSAILVFLIFTFAFTCIAFSTYLLQYLMGKNIFPTYLNDFSTAPPLQVIFTTIIFFRLTSGLLRGILIGINEINKVSYTNIFISFNRFILASVLMQIFSWTLTDFFLWQLLASIIEIVIYIFLNFIHIANIKQNKTSIRPNGYTNNLISVLIRSSQIFIPALIWILITQGDKAILAYNLDAVEFSYFSTAFMITTFIILANGGIATVITPHLSFLNDQKDEKALLFFYANSTAIISITGSFLTSFLFINASNILQYWTGDAGLASYGGEVVKLYSIGHMLMLLAGVPYGVQFAKQSLDLHVKGNIIFIIVYIPLLYLIVPTYHAVGAGWLWITINAFWLLVWCFVVHVRFFPGFHATWLIRYIAVPLLPNVGMAIFLKIFLLPVISNVFLDLIISAIILFLTSACSFVYLQQLRLKEL